MRPNHLFSSFVALAICVTHGGCASGLNRQAQRSSGLFDFVGRVARGPRRQAIPVERYSGRAVEIASADAEIERGGTMYVSGVLKRGFEANGNDDGHIDVKVIGPTGQLVAAVAVDYLPRLIPATYHGIAGRAYFGVRLPIVPPPESFIRVVFHQAE